nr:uncharacterized protein LOC118877059 [Drosophila suzukii]
MAGDILPAEDGRTERNSRAKRVITYAPRCLPHGLKCPSGRSFLDMPLKSLFFAHFYEEHAFPGKQFRPQKPLYKLSCQQFQPYRNDLIFTPKLFMEKATFCAQSHI